MLTSSLEGPAGVVEGVGTVARYATTAFGGGGCSLSCLLVNDSEFLETSGDCLAEREGAGNIGDFADDAAEVEWICREDTAVWADEDFVGFAFFEDFTSRVAPCAVKLMLFFARHGF